MSFVYLWQLNTVLYISFNVCRLFVCASLIRCCISILIYAVCLFVPFLRTSSSFLQKYGTDDKGFYRFLTCRFLPYQSLVTTVPTSVFWLFAGVCIQHVFVFVCLVLYQLANVKSSLSYHKKDPHRYFSLSVYRSTRYRQRRVTMWIFLVIVKATLYVC